MLKKSVSRFQLEYVDFMNIFLNKKSDNPVLKYRFRDEYYQITHRYRWDVEGKSGSVLTHHFGSYYTFDQAYEALQEVIKAKGKTAVKNVA
jgi:hypothetical protein